MENMIMKRLSVDKYYLNIAKAVAARSTCLIRQYGAVIVNNDESYRKEFPQLCGRGLLRSKIKGKRGGEK